MGHALTLLSYFCYIGLYQYDHAKDYMHRIFSPRLLALVELTHDHCTMHAQFTQRSSDLILND